MIRRQRPILTRHLTLGELHVLTVEGARSDAIEAKAMMMHAVTNASRPIWNALCPVTMSADKKASKSKGP